jgi:alpha-L-fucosidase
MKMDSVTNISKFVAMTLVVTLALADKVQAQEPLKNVDNVISAGPFSASWESLAKYTVPQWYLDAKFGIFIHWGVYSVPAFGSEWYPRNMYQQDSNEFNHHIATYGPQNKFGYKDFVPMFKAEKFDPNHWAEVFKKAGAKFVVPVAEHHDGFAMYDCSFSKWCAAEMGPKRDVVGELASAVRKQGLTFGLSSHRAEHWWFFDGGIKFDSDVKDPNYAGLYGPAQPEKESTPSKEFLDDWFARSCELVDKYQPQLVWFDWWIEQPVFAPYLQKFAAYYYNRGAQWQKGVAINYKNKALPENVAVLDIERGQLAGIRPLFWQTDTSISRNSWGYVTKQDYKTADLIIDDLIDIVSKNGALLLNISPKPDGTIPEDEEKILLEIGQWLAVNGEAIYGTRPFKVFGEGPTQVIGGSFGDTKRQVFTGQDIRFTTKGETLYAIALAWPGEQITIKSLAKSSPLVGGKVKDVRLLGNRGRLEWLRNEAGLTIELPAQKPCEHAFVLKISGLSDLEWDGFVRQNRDGSVTLDAGTAELHGKKIGLEQRAKHQSIGLWDDPQEWASWKVKFHQSGFYEVSALLTAASGETEFSIEVGGQTLVCRAPKTADGDDFQTVIVGSIDIKEPGEHIVRVRPRDAQTWKAMNLALIELKKAANKK